MEYGQQLQLRDCESIEELFMHPSSHYLSVVTGLEDWRLQKKNNWCPDPLYPGDGPPRSSIQQPDMNWVLDVESSDSGPIGPVGGYTQPWLVCLGSVLGTTPALLGGVKAQHWQQGLWGLYKLRWGTGRSQGTLEATRPSVPPRVAACTTTGTWGLGWHLCRDRRGLHNGQWRPKGSRDLSI